MSIQLLIDADIVVYRCAFAAEKTRYVLTDEWGKPVAGPFDNAAARNQWLEDEDAAETYNVLHSESYKEYEPLSHALANVKSVMARIANVGDVKGVFLSKGECFRHKLATMKKYKGNRDHMPKPKYYQDVRDYLTKHYGALVFESIEADDALAMCQNDRTCIVSIDKDLLQVPGMHYDWVNDKKKLITPEVGLRKLWLQVLTGDGTDNIPGIRGVGGVKARKLLADVPDEGLAQECLRIWTEYLESDASKPIEDMTCEDGTVRYIPWFAPLDEQDSYWHAVAPEAIMHEVYNLVKVGGEHAEKAAEEAGEAILLTR